MADDKTTEELEGKDGKGTEDIEEVTNPSDETLTTEEVTQEGKKGAIPYDRFKQKVDEANALKEKLAKIERDQAEAARKKLEEQNEYKTLYEQALETIEQHKADALNGKKDALIIQAGYSEDQAKVIRKLVEGDSDEEIKASIESLKSTFPVEKKKDYVDPGATNERTYTPESKDAEDIGRNMFDHLFKSGKLKGLKK